MSVQLRFLCVTLRIAQLLINSPMHRRLWSMMFLQEVVDPLLEKGKAAWNKQQAKLEKRLRAQTDTRGGK